MSGINISKLKRFLITLSVTVTIILIALLVLDWQSRSNFEKYDKEAARIISLAGKADGVTKVQTTGGTAGQQPGYKRGEGLINSWRYCSAQDQCPVANKNVLVLLPKDHEDEFVSSLLDLSGYDHKRNGGCQPFIDTTSFCSENRSNAEYQMSLSINVADPYHHGAPAQDDGASAEVWRYVTITVAPRRY